MLHDITTVLHFLDEAPTEWNVLLCLSNLSELTLRCLLLTDVMDGNVCNLPNISVLHIESCIHRTKDLITLLQAFPNIHSLSFNNVASFIATSPSLLGSLYGHLANVQSLSYKRGDVVTVRMLTWALQGPTLNPTCLECRNCIDWPSVFNLIQAVGLCLEDLTIGTS